MLGVNKFSEKLSLVPEIIKVIKNLPQLHNYEKEKAMLEKG